MANQIKEKWYDNNLNVIILCILFFPVGLYALWKNRFISKGWKIGVSVVFGLIIIASLGNTDQSVDKTSYTIASSKSNLSDDQVEQTKENIQPDKTDDEKLKEQLERELKAFDEKPFDGSKYRESVESIQMEVVLFSVWASIVNKAKISDDIEIQKLGEKMKNKVQKLQVSEFPKLRKAYKEIVSDKLWLENIETNIKSKGVFSKCPQNSQK